MKENAIMNGILANSERILKQAPARDGVVLVSGADLKPEPVRWLWGGWLALGKLHILAGAPGQGKTTLALALAASVTSGASWPDGTPSLPGNVLVWSGEDDPADTLLPRLLAAGADRSRVFFVSGTRLNGKLDSFDPARDMPELQTEAERIGNIRLIIIDPVVSAVKGDSHRNTETRRALQPLVDLAARIGAAVLGITHFSKGGQGGDPTQRVVGSVAFAAVARVVLVAAKVKGNEGEERRILARSKSNIGPDDDGFEYRIDQSEPLPGIHASYVAWGDPVTGAARELLTDANAADDDVASAVDSAADFLVQVLGNDVVPSKSVYSEAQEFGVAKRTLERASRRLSVKKQRGGDGKWYWSMPKPANFANFAKLANDRTLAKLADMADFNQSNAEGASNDQV